MAFAPAYVSCVLSDNFEDAKQLFLSPLLSVHYAHLVMLVECGIVQAADAHALREALDGIAARDLRTATFDGSVEDLFFFLHRLIAESCGETAAGRLHAARSRNDVDMTMYRMRQREYVLGLFDASLGLRRALLGLAERHRDTIVAVHTHAQPAQPTTLAHFLLAMVEQLERDGVRLRAAYEVTNRSPLGACAITGTGFPIDRRITSDLLGFAAPTGNTYGSVAAVDFMVENVSAAAVMMVGFGRFVQELLLWSMAEFGFLTLGDGFVQASSIMPQKRNPVALEHARGIASKALGQAMAVVTSVHNTPFGDVVDTEDDLQPLVFSTFRDAARAVKLVASAMETASFDTTRLESYAADCGATMTELADTLVRERDLPFRTAHEIVSRVARASREHSGAALSRVLAQASEDVTGTPIDLSEAQLAEALSPRHFVEVRRTAGGPARVEVDRAIAEAGERLAADACWLSGTRDRLISAENRLRERSATL